MKTKAKILGLAAVLSIGLAGMAHANNKDLVIEKGSKKVLDLRNGPVIIHPL
ncbi:MAG: hypothetical protein P4L53_18090 [Candidatus Obscuribacterales bacterium]|nr:hypothetical protein [Candidatus Obscuribacterales bacterium]